MSNDSLGRIQVWILLYKMDYSGAEVLSVWDSENKAEAEIQRIRKSRVKHKPYWRDLAIEPWYVE